jgi:CRP-like cAMP-binding protein
MRKKQLQRGEVLIDEGSEHSEMYIIRSGRLRVFKTINGERVELATLKQNEFVGEIAALLGTAATASVAAVEDSEVEVLTQEELAALVQKRPQTGMKMIRILAERLRRANELISKISGEKTSLEIIYGLKQ